MKNKEFEVKMLQKIHFTLLGRLLILQLKRYHKRNFDLPQRIFVLEALVSIQALFTLILDR